MKYSTKRDKNLILLEYEITYDAIEHRSLKKLPKNIRNNIADLHDKAHYRPKEIIPELKKLAEKYFNVPILMNYLSAAYSRIGDFKNAEKVVLKNYKRHPNYLFAKINYAQICLENNEFEKIPIIFDNKFDLCLLYPHRKEFHFTEFVSFNGITCRYFMEIGEREKADAYFKLLKSIAPRNKTTKIIKRVLYPSLYRRIINRIVKKREKKIKYYENKQKIRYSVNSLKIYD